MIAIAVAAGLVAGSLTGGSTGRLFDTRFRLAPLVVLALAARFGLALSNPDDGWPDSLALGIQLGSILLAAGFCVANIHVRAMPVVLMGIALNAFVVAINGGMPLKLDDAASDSERAALDRSAIHVAEGDAVLPVLGQTIPVPEPVDRHVSFGDLILGVGLADLVFRAMRSASPAVRTTAATAVRGVTSAPGADGRSASDYPRERREDAVVSAT